MNRIQNFMRICALLDQIVEEEAEGSDEFAIQILDRHRKTRDIVRVRERVLRRARTEIWEKKSGSPQWEVCGAKHQPSPSWKPLGYLQIAAVLGGNHSAWVKMAKTIDMSPLPEEPAMMAGVPCQVRIPMVG